MINLRQADRYPKCGSGEPRFRSPWQHCTWEPQAPGCCAAVWCFPGSAGDNTPKGKRSSDCTVLGIQPVDRMLRAFPLLQTEKQFCGL